MKNNCHNFTESDNNFISSFTESDFFYPIRAMRNFLTVTLILSVVCNQFFFAEACGRRGGGGCGCQAQRAPSSCGCRKKREVGPVPKGRVLSYSNYPLLLDATKALRDVENLMDEFEKDHLRK